jgi:uncharacterized protein YeaO (DUF488 family)
MKTVPVIRLKRAYEKAESEDGARLLVERLWPRGVKKEALKIERWAKDVAPTTELRQWFGHDPEKWAEFKRRYLAELRANPEGWENILEEAGRQPVTLVYSSHDEVHNNAVALREFLLERAGHG